jgi:hypothetical protein
MKKRSPALNSINAFYPNMGKWTNNKVTEVIKKMTENEMVEAVHIIAIQIELGLMWIILFLIIKKIF